MADISKIILPNNQEYDLKDAEAREQLRNKQDTLISGENIKTVNGQSLIGDGNIEIIGQAGPEGPQGLQGPQGPQGPQGTPGSNIVINNEAEWRIALEPSDLKTINGQSIIGEGDIHIGDDKSDIDRLDTKINMLVDEIIMRDLDGTKNGYEKAMRNWFKLMGYGSTPSEITNLVSIWYSKTRTDWCGGTTFKQPDISTSSDGVKIGDNNELICIPSTDTIANRDDYAGNPLFAVTTVNWILDDDGNPIITAIKGIHDWFEQNNPNKYVGVMQMSAWTYCDEDESTYTIGYSAKYDSTLPNIKPLPESVNVDGTVREYIIHSKYMSGTVDGKMTSCSGIIPTAFLSHNSLITLSDKNGSNYSGSTITDWSFLVLMTIIKYASMTQDARIQGCLNYNYQYYARISEQNVNRVIINKNEGNNLLVGSSVIIGTYNGSTDRGQASLQEFTPNGAIITSIEDITINETTYSAVYVNTDLFNSTANPGASGGTILSTWHWISGTNDSVLENDGSIKSTTNGKYPAMIQGIEYFVGGYEVMADTIMNIADGYYEVMIANNKRYQATFVTSSMRKSRLRSQQLETDSWNYIRRLAYDGEIFFGTDTIGGSSSTYTKDAFYKNSISTKTGIREWLAFGRLSSSTGSGGLSCLLGADDLSFGTWSYLARLSANGNRGELTI